MTQQPWQGQPQGVGPTNPPTVPPLASPTAPAPHQPPAAPGGPAAGQQPVGVFSYYPLPTGPVVPAAEPALPVVGREYHEFYRAPRWRWWRGLLALLALAISFLAASLVLGAIGMGIAVALGEPMPSLDDQALTPSLFLINNVSLAAFIPLSMLVQWWVVGQRPGWLSSVVGRLRWRWLGVCLAICLPIWLLLVGSEVVMAGMPELSYRGVGHTVLLIATILLTTPLQAAGEEYMARGLVARVIGAWVPSRIAGLAAAAVVTGLLFMSLHMAADPWLNAFYFSFGVLASLIVWRTGGLEATIAIHVVNNVLSEWSMPFTDISGMMDRSAGTGDWTIVLPLAAILLAWGLMELAAKKMGIQRINAPGDVPQQLATAGGLPGAPQQYGSQPGYGPNPGYGSQPRDGQQPGFAPGPGLPAPDATPQPGQGQPGQENRQA